jgi:hypothetical protein
MKALFTIAFFLPLWLSAQTKGDSLLSTERSIDRPITLHKRQFRLSPAYSLAVIAKRFDEFGDSHKLRNEGLSSFKHRFAIDIKYGVSEFIQLSTSFSHVSQTVRDQTRRIIPDNSTSEPLVNENRLYNYTGLEDVIVTLDLRAPFKTKRLDIGLTTGISMPTAKYKPDRPSHSIEYVEDDLLPRFNFVYRYNDNLGKGVSILHVGGMIKYRLQHWAFSARMDYRHGLSDGDSYRWKHQLIGYETFDYRQENFRFRLPDTFDYYGEIEYQALPWFDLIMNVSGSHGQNGWQTVGPYKVEVPDATLIMLNPGVELIVTPRLWFRQELQIPLAGKNVEGALTFYTSLLYNFFLK